MLKEKYRQKRNKGKKRIIELYNHFNHSKSIRYEETFQVNGGAVALGVSLTGLES
jgi:hypothetical protein